MEQTVLNRQAKACHNVRVGGWTDTNRALGSTKVASGDIGERAAESTAQLRAAVTISGHFLDFGKLRFSSGTHRLCTHHGST